MVECCEFIGTIRTLSGKKSKEFILETDLMNCSDKSAKYAFNHLIVIKTITIFICINTRRSKHAVDTVLCRFSRITRYKNNNAGFKRVLGRTFSDHLLSFLLSLVKYLIRITSICSWSIGSISLVLYKICHKPA